MHYMLMCYFDQKAWTQLPDNEKNQDHAGIWSVDTEPRHERTVPGGGPLAPTSSATTVCMKNGKTVLTDGPFAETKEQLGGYHVVECRDLDEALAIAARIPTLPAGGAIEVRPFGSTHENDVAARG